MLEKIGDEEIVVQNYVDNFNVKEYIQEELIPKAFPNIPMNKLNLGFTGVVSEYISQGIEDSQATSSLMINESFINKAMLPSSIYAKASLYNLGYRFATPSTCTFALEISLSDIKKFSTGVDNNQVKRYCIDKDTQLFIGDIGYKLDYDIFIDRSDVSGNEIYNVYYNIEEENSISKITSKYIKYQVTSSGWMILFLDLQQFNRKTDTVDITDNIITTNSEIPISWEEQIAGIDLIYITPQGQRIPMILKNEYTKAEVSPFAWYRYDDESKMYLSFSSNEGFWTPAFNSKIEYTVYYTFGSVANFDTYDKASQIPVRKVGLNYSYNSSSTMVALCCSGSTGGYDRESISDLRDEVIAAKNTCNVLNTDKDLDLWFQLNGKRYNNGCKFFKRRDDPTGKLFSQFILIKKDNEIYPTNTLNLQVAQSDCDFVNDINGIDTEFVIEPGHVWEYVDDSRTDIRMVKLKDSEGNDIPVMITDDIIPSITEDRPFMFINPFYIKINRDPMVSMSYNYLLNHVSWPTELPLNEDSMYKFQLGQFTIERSLYKKHNNMYHIEIVCVPVIADDSANQNKYVSALNDINELINNDLRLVLITETEAYGETGYLEMTPIEIQDGGGIVFQADIAVYDNLRDDMTLEVDLEKTPTMQSLITEGIETGKVLIDADESRFGFAVMYKDATNTSTTNLFNNETYNGYTMTNRFINDYRDLVLYTPMQMMRNTISFEGSNHNYTITLKSVSVIKYNVALDEEMMAHFIQCFNDQYHAMKPVLSKLDGNDSIDFKLYNTYGRSTNYYIGPKQYIDENGNTYFAANFKDSDLLLDNVNVKVKIAISVYDRTLYNQTTEEVVSQIIQCFDELSDDDPDLHVYKIFNRIRENIPNIKNFRFIGFNDYDANQQSIFIKYNYNDSEEILMNYVPEKIRVDSSSIDITEEIW